MSVVVRTAEPAELDAVLLKMFELAGVADPAGGLDSLRAAERDGKLNLDTVLVAEKGEAVAGVQLCVLPGDGSALVWVPEAASEAVRQRLMRAAVRMLDGAGVRFSQVLRPPGHASAGFLNEAGFAKTTELISFVASPPFAGGRFDEGVPFSDADAEAWGATLAATYEGSLDCPEANGVRTGAEAVESHRAAAGGDTGLWRRFLIDGRPAGLLLANAEPAFGSTEIAYLGVVPGCRGRGLGRRMLKGLLGRLPPSAASVFVTCDARNTPAVRLYESLGFAAEARQELWLRFGVESGPPKRTNRF